MASFPSLPFPTISGGRTASASASTSGANTTSSSSNTTSNNTATASARPPSPSTPSVSGSSIFETRRAYLPEDTDAGSLRTAITDDDRSGSPAPSLNMPRAAAVSSRGKRKRLSKACDSCHKSKRRCDGTSPCANCDFAGKPCVYTDANGRTVPPPRSREHEEEHHPTNRPRRHSVSVAHILTHGQHNPEERGGLTYATSALPMAPLDPHHPRPPIPIPGQHHLIPPQPPRPFDTPVPPPPSYYYPYYRRPESESEEDIRARNRRRYESFPPPEPAERGLYLGLNIVSPRTSMGRLCGDKGALTVEPHLARELVNLFFNNQYLASFMFHRPTFMLALTKGQVPMPLLNSIFALAAPYSSQPSLRTNPSWHAGERFAQAANAELFDQSGQLALRPDLAVAQALSLLVLHECVMRRPTTNDRHMCIAFQIMKDLGVATMDDPATFPSSSTPERDMLDQWISSECHRRTFWVLYVLESLSSAFTSRPMTFKDSQLKVRLPVDEASFEFGLRGESSSEYLQFPMSQAKPSSTGEFGHLVRVTWIYTTVMNQIAELNKKGRPPGPGDSVTMDTINHSEQCLHASELSQSWESSLPERLRFDSETLHNQIQALNSGASTGGWTYAYMHALAECSILGLHELLEVMPNREVARAHAVRQQRALDNLTVILGSLGTRGRKSIWCGTLLLAVVRYRAILSPQPDPHVTEWCAEFHQQWGVSLAELVNPEFRRVWCASVKPKENSATPTPPPPSPPSRSPAGYPTMVMSASQVTLPPLQSFGLLHHPPQVGSLHPSSQGGSLHPSPGGGMHAGGSPSVHGPSPIHTPLPPLMNSNGPPTGGDGSMHAPPDRRIGGMPRGLPWLEDELKNGNGVAPTDVKGGAR